MSFAIGFIHTTTCRTRPAGIAWVNRDNSHSGEFCLVLNFLAQIVKRPVAMPCPLLSTNRYPVADATQVFKGDTASSVFRLLHDTLTDRVVGVFLKARLFAAELLKFTAGAVRALALQIAPAILEPTTVLVDSITRINFTVAIRSDVDNTQVNTEELVNITGFGRFNFAGDKQIKFAVDVAQVAFTAFGLQQLLLPFTGKVRHFLAAFQCPDANHLLVRIDRQDAVIVGKCAKRVKHTLNFSVQFVGVGHLADGADSHLRRQTEVGANVFVGQMVQGVLLEDLMFPRQFRNVVASVIGTFQRLQQECVLFWRRLQFDLRSQFHIGSIHHKALKRKCGAAPSIA